MPRSGFLRILRRLTVLLGILVAVVALVVLSGIPAYRIKHHFERGRDLLAGAQTQVLDGDAAGAHRSFAAAQAEFRAAVHQPDNLLLRAESWIPYLGRTPDALLALARIGEEASRAGTDVTAEIAKLPGGLSALGLHDGKLPLDTLRSLAPAMSQAAAALERAQREAGRLPGSWLLAPVRQARDLVRERLDRTVPLAVSGDALLRSLPSFAGADGPKRYFVVVQNSAELRGTGGIIGNFAILTIDRGRMALGEFHDIDDLPTLPAEKAPSPSEEFTDLYGQFGGGGFWLNINMTPDTPTAATLMEQLYQRVRGERLDGTILFDLQGLANLLDATGPVEVKDLHYTFTPDNVVGYVARGDYIDSGIPEPNGNGPRLVAQAIWNRFLSSTDPDAAMAALLGAGADGHLLLHSVDPAVESAFQLAGVGGQFGPAQAAWDFFSAISTNAAANKVDYYLDQDVSYHIALKPGGSGHAEARVRFSNEAPKDARPSYALGASDAAKSVGLHLVPGEDRLWTQVYCAAHCWLTGSTVDGKPAGLEQHGEKGQTLFAGFVDVLPQQSADLGTSFDLSGVWQGDDASGTYRLALQGQPTIRPIQATVAVQVPPGMHVAGSNVPMQVKGDTATWTGTLHLRQVIEVRFERGYFGRIWSRVIHAVDSSLHLN